ncbi:Disease resistance-like protein CSA1 [Vitis vinifera]|uniref:Disease resistance-like protein CSA1 n=1 Tax=Vitis vinifera TaxID=29760 RepID=A0A438BVU3_VITVI|nr:Disease resistance-like protein CSA1 [Vitis vinifera]
MCFSRLKQLWEGKKGFEKLKSIKLGHSQHLTKIPDFSGVPNLRRLILKGCKKLKSFSSSIHMESLQILTLSGCSKLKKFPETQEASRDSGKHGEFDGAFLDGSELKELPDDLGSLQCLAELNADGSGALPSDLGSIPSLERLDLSRNSFITIPASLSGLSRLRSLTLEYCKSLQSLPELPSSVERENQGSDIVGAILEGIQLMSSIPKFLVPDRGIPTPHNEYNALVPGSRIPEWFRHQSVGCSVNIELPQHWYNTKLMGLAFCAALNFKGAMDGNPGTEPSSFGLVCYLNDCFVETGLHSLYTPPDGSKFIESDHTLFEYISLARLEICLGNWFRKLSDNVVASFALTGSDGEVKKCGIRLVYEEDEKDGGCSFPFGTTWPGMEMEMEMEMTLTTKKVF